MLRPRVSWRRSASWCRTVTILPEKRTPLCQDLPVAFFTAIVFSLAHLVLVSRKTLVAGLAPLPFQYLLHVNFFQAVCHFLESLRVLLLWIKHILLLLVHVARCWSWIHEIGLPLLLLLRVRELAFLDFNLRSLSFAPTWVLYYFRVRLMLRNPNPLCTTQLIQFLNFVKQHLRLLSPLSLRFFLPLPRQHPVLLPRRRNRSACRGPVVVPSLYNIPILHRANLSNLNLSAARGDVRGDLAVSGIASSARCTP